MSGRAGIAYGETVDKWEMYERVRTLGRGSYGKAMLCRHRATGDHVVIKRIETSPRGVPCDATHMRRVVKEVEVMKALNHKHVVALFDVWQTVNAVYIAMEFCEYDDLNQLKRRTQAENKIFPESFIQKIFRQAALALVHLHTKGVLHRDIKAANIFLTKRKHSTHIKLGDFGLSTVLEGSTDLAVSRVGTPYYMSPEVMQGRGYSCESDIWSLGVTMYEVMYFRYPFRGENIFALQRKVFEAAVRHPTDMLDDHGAPFEYSPILRVLIDRCFLPPSARVTARQIVGILTDHALYERAMRDRDRHGRAASAPHPATQPPPPQPTRAASAQPVHSPTPTLPGTPYHTPERDHNMTPTPYNTPACGAAAPNTSPAAVYGNGSARATPAPSPADPACRELFPQAAQATLPRPAPFPVCFGAAGGSEGASACADADAGEPCTSMPMLISISGGSADASVATAAAAPGAGAVVAGRCDSGRGGVRGGGYGEEPQAEHDFTPASLAHSCDVLDGPPRSPCGADRPPPGRAGREAFEAMFDAPPRPTAPQQLVTAPTAAAAVAAAVSPAGVACFSPADLTLACLAEGRGSGRGRGHSQPHGARPQSCPPPAASTMPDGGHGRPRSRSSPAVGAAATPASVVHRRRGRMQPGGEGEQLPRRNSRGARRRATPGALRPRVLRRAGSAGAGDRGVLQRVAAEQQQERRRALSAGSGRRGGRAATQAASPVPAPAPEEAAEGARWLRLLRTSRRANSAGAAWRREATRLNLADTHTSSSIAADECRRSDAAVVNPSPNADRAPAGAHSLPAPRPRRARGCLKQPAAAAMVPRASRVRGASHGGSA